MLRKICNYLAVIALSLVVAGNSVLAHSTVVKGKNDVKSFKVEENKDFHLYREFLRGGGTHSYTIKVNAGEEVKIKIHASNGVSLKIQTPNGQTKNNSAEKYFEVKLNAEGEYVVELESLFVSQYTMEVLSK